MFGVAWDITGAKVAEKQIVAGKKQLDYWQDLMRYVIEHFSWAVAVRDSNMNYLCESALPARFSN
jgi:hypothetical protein